MREEGVYFEKSVEWQGVNRSRARGGPRGGGGKELWLNEKTSGSRVDGGREDGERREASDGG